MWIDATDRAFKLSSRCKQSSFWNYGSKDEKATECCLKIIKPSTPKLKTRPRTAATLLRQRRDLKLALYAPLLVLHPINDCLNKDLSKIGKRVGTSNATPRDLGFWRGSHHQSFKKAYRYSTANICSALGRVDRSWSGETMRSDPRPEI